LGAVESLMPAGPQPRCRICLNARQKTDQICSNADAYHATDLCQERTSPTNRSGTASFDHAGGASCLFQGLTCLPWVDRNSTVQSVWPTIADFIRRNLECVRQHAPHRR